MRLFDADRAKYTSNGIPDFFSAQEKKIMEEAAQKAKRAAHEATLALAEKAAIEAAQKAVFMAAEGDSLAARLAEVTMPGECHRVLLLLNYNDSQIHWIQSSFP